MARYIVIRVESNESAQRLLERFAVVPAIRVVGLFASPNKFCDGKCEREKNDLGVRKTVRSKKWGLTFCPECKLPLASVMQRPRNLLQDVDLHPRFADMFISVWEPFTNEPAKKYGQAAIDNTKAQVERAGERISRSKRRTRRRKKVDHG